ncbi:MAG: hypothetical protein M1832_002967 [Thelocarpon impressellum]|nr:MAG: hypothetical protein M1832_002967 [Thelocarpon impressellum]
MASEPPPPYSPDDPNAKFTLARVATDVPAAGTPPNVTPVRRENASEIIFTPPSTPGGSTYPSSAGEQAEHGSLSSGSLYFGERPSLIRRPSVVLVHRLVVPSDAHADELSYPQPEEQWQARDVSQFDWSTFVNHVCPQHLTDANIGIAERKMRAEFEYARAHDSKGVAHSPSNDELYPAQLGTLPGLQEKGALDAVAAGESEEERARRMAAVVAEWNAGFFQPRGLRVDVVDGRPRSSIDRPPSSACSARASGKLPAYDEEDRRSVRSGLGPFRFLKQYAQARGQTESPPWAGRRAAAAECGGPPWRQRQAGCQAGPSRSCTEPARRAPQCAPPQRRQRSSSVASTASTASSASASSLSSLESAVSVSSSRLDKLDAVELAGLLQSVSAFVASPRSRDENRAALRELRHGLRGGGPRRVAHDDAQTRKAAKAELRALVKQLRRAHKSDWKSRRAEVRARQRERKDERKQCRQARKDERRQNKQARKDERRMSKQARKESRRAGQCGGASVVADEAPVIALPVRTRSLAEAVLPPPSGGQESGVVTEDAGPVPARG